MSSPLLYIVKMSVGKQKHNYETLTVNIIITTIK